MSKLAHLPGRAVIEVAGEDRVGFLQGLVSNDVAAVAPGRAVWAALLTPQGKWLADFFALSDGARLLLDCEAAQADDLTRRLARFRLRAKVSVARTPLHVHAAWDGAPVPPPGARCTAAPDPRLADAGWRVLADAPPPATATGAAWDLHRLRPGLPDGSRDLAAASARSAAAGFAALHNGCWPKGC